MAMEFVAEQEVRNTPPGSICEIGVTTLAVQSTNGMEVVVSKSANVGIVLGNSLRIWARDHPNRPSAPLDGRIEIKTTVQTTASGKLGLGRTTID